jgi:hypothetical protein
MTAFDQLTSGYFTFTLTSKIYQTVKPITSNYEIRQLAKPGGSYQHSLSGYLPQLRITLTIYSLLVR